MSVNLGSFFRRPMTRVRMIVERRLSSQRSWLLRSWIGLIAVIGALSAGQVSAAELVATYTTGQEVPHSGESYTATDKTVSFALNYAPATGTELTVVRNTGPAFIGGAFSNLAQGQAVRLTYGGFAYDFVANYYGGSGNDLVLVWKNNRAFAWGFNGYGHLGNNSTTQSLVPVAVTATGVLNGKTLLGGGAGRLYSLALCSDGTVATWGHNDYGELGNNSTTQSLVPVAVTATGVLNGKTVVGVAAGAFHSVALCSDGTVASWGRNTEGQLGNNSTTKSQVPVAVTATGVLNGKTVVKVAAGENHSLALCSDGTVAAWGYNGSGQLGNNSTVRSLVPVEVTATGVLNGKTVVGVAAGGFHSVALCSDGTVAAWGAADSGQLGNNSTVQSLVPVAVTATGVLNGKAVVGVAAGGFHSVALCSDGTVAAWGYNGNGQLGNNSTVQRQVPVAVAATGVLNGKTVVSVAAGVYHSVALCSDGTLATWGGNYSGQLGNNSMTHNRVPVAVTSTPLAAGERFTRLFRDSVPDNHTLALVAVPPATEIVVTGNGSNISDGDSTPVVGNHTDFGGVAAGASVVRTFTITNAGTAPLNLSGTPQVVMVSGAQAADFVVTRQPEAVVAAGGSTTFEVTFGPSGVSTSSATLSFANDDADEGSYEFEVRGSRSESLVVVYTTGQEVPRNVVAYAAAGGTVTFALNYAPVTGTELTVVRNSGLGFIRGEFSNLPQGQTVRMMYGAIAYDFVADYYGGSGNDLVLVWKNNRALAWGLNTYGQLGNRNRRQSPVPVPVTLRGILAGKTVVELAAGDSHSVALCSDGTLATWGSAYQLGNNGTVDSEEPVEVTMSGVLNGKRVVAVAAGRSHSVALCSDGTLVAWGGNDLGQLGNNSTMLGNVPVAVTMGGALNGKKVVGVTAGASYSVALCSDGTLVAWGGNYSGQLGNNSMADSRVPVAVTMNGVLSGKTVVDVAAGQAHTVALCSDGTLAAWGYNYTGPLGNSSTTSSLVPVTVTMNGVLNGKTVVGVAAGIAHSMALCSDGTVVTWGGNWAGQLGNNRTTNSSAPVAVTATGTLKGKSVVAVAAGHSHSMALCSDGTAAAWGHNLYGQLGNNSMTDSLVPMPVSSTPLAPGERFTQLFHGGMSGHTLALVAAPPAPEIAVTGRGINIPDGDGAPSSADETDFGVVAAGAGVVKTFTITNEGTAPLNLGGNPRVVVSGAQAADFVVTRQPDAVVAPGAATAFEVTFNAGAVGGRSAVLSIANNDADEGSYDFAVVGTEIGEVVASYTTGREVPQSGPVLTAVGSTVSFELNYAPETGTELMVMRNTGPAFINGQFGNLAQGQTVRLMYGGMAYEFVANYYGGSGNDLVLAWKNNRSFAWGANNYGQLGNNSMTESPVPVPVLATGALQGKMVSEVSAGFGHSMALCSDGTVAAWGLNHVGQLGNDSTTNNPAPVSVTTAWSPTLGGLAGKRVVAVAAGANHSAALCSDGTVALWGWNNYGQLGNNTHANRRVPVTVAATGGLLGKTVVAVAAGEQHTVVLCSDGTLAAWGRNFHGQLGDNSTTDSPVPVAVTMGGALKGKTVVEVAAGGRHTVVLCSDGTLAAWGYNVLGQLGNNSRVDSPVPVTVAATGVLSGKTVVEVTAGGEHTMALCSDGTLATWGRNTFGQLGNNSTQDRLVPGAVTTTRVLSGKRVTEVAAGPHYSMALCSDGTVAAWGMNYFGQLGNNSSTVYPVSVPVAVTTTPLAAGERFSGLFRGGALGNHNLALVAAPPTPEIVVTGKGVDVADGDSTPTGADDTDFGSVSAVTGRVVRTFTITNAGTAPLYLTGSPRVSVSGGEAADYVVTKLPAAVVAVAGSTTFEVTFDPSTSGLRSATMGIASNDGDEAVFNFAIQGTGLNSSLTGLSLTQTSIAENGGTNAVVGTLVTEDADGSDTHSFTLVSGTGDADNGAFNISGSFLRLNAGADFETKPSYTVRVRATDSGVPTESLEKIFTITVTNVNEVPPLLGTALGPPMLNRATGLMEYVVRVTNGSGAVLEGVRVTVTNLPSGYQLWNKTHATLPLIELRQVIPIGGTVDVKVAIYSRSRALGTWVPAVTAQPLTEVSLDPATRTVASAGGSYDVNVLTVGVWSVTESLAWASVSVVDGVSTGSVTVTVQPNASLAARTGVIRIGSKDHTITQAGVLPPVIGPVNASHPAIVSGSFSLVVPTENLPATHSVTGLPKGLSVDAATGVISGKPTVAGNFNVSVSARNAAGTSLARYFRIMVEPLAEGVVGLFHGYVESDAVYRVSPSPEVAARLEVTVTPTGGISGFLLEGATRKSLTGVLDSTVADPQKPTAVMTVPGTTLVLALAFDGATNALTARLRLPADGPGLGAPAFGWRKVWRTTAPVNLATEYKARHNGALISSGVMPELGRGYVSFSITSNTAEVTLLGRLPDGSVISGSTFVGPAGQVLMYLPLYGNRGSCYGGITVSPGANAPADNEVKGTLSWWKPTALPGSTETLYRAGFDEMLTVDGGTYAPPLPGGRVLGLTAGSNNAQLRFNRGPLISPLSQLITVANPKPAGQTNTAVVGSPNPNAVTITSFDTATGLFQGKFTVAGPGSLSRTVDYFGQISNTTSGPSAAGHFIMPMVPTPPQTLSTVPKIGGLVELEASR